MGINFQNVNFKYSKKASTNTLDHVSLEINGVGEFIAILGHTGSGKSTLSQLMNALLLPSSGEVNIFGQTTTNNKKLKLKKIRSAVGLVFQFPEYQLFEDSVLKDIMFGPRNFGMNAENAKKKALEVAKLVGIEDELLERSPFSLSGGQMRRVAIAGILASDPDILILDEPTVGLDPKGKDELMELLNKVHLQTNKTIIMITHDMNVVTRYAKRALVMKNGTLVYDGKIAPLFNDPNKLSSFNLELPECAKLASELKNRGLIQFDELPLTKEALLDVILSGGKPHE